MKIRFYKATMLYAFLVLLTNCATTPTTQSSNADNNLANTLWTKDESSILRDNDTRYYLFLKNGNMILISDNEMLITPANWSQKKSTVLFKTFYDDKNDKASFINKNLLNITAAGNGKNYQVTLVEDEDIIARFEPYMKLPSFKNHLENGRNQFRIINPNDYAAYIVIIRGDSGKYLIAKPGYTITSYIPNGVYKIYFIFSEEPESLYQGDDFRLNGNGIELELTDIEDGNFSIKRAN